MFIHFPRNRQRHGTIIDAPVRPLELPFAVPGGRVKLLGFSTTNWSWGLTLW
jgi:hypothetical protein